jgi:hypothetical protein
LDFGLAAFALVSVSIMPPDGIDDRFDGILRPRSLDTVNDTVNGVRMR